MTLERELRLPSGHTVTFLRTGAETDGALLEFEAVIPPHSSGPPTHLHTREQEEFTIVEGRLAVRIGKERLAARPGDQVKVPPTTVHGFANRTDDPVKLLVQMTPAGNLEQLLRIQAASKYLPLLRIAEVNHGADATLFLAGVPLLPQRLVLDGLAAFNRLHRRHL